jgi:hypothetical protein
LDSKVKASEPNREFTIYDAAGSTKFQLKKWALSNLITVINIWRFFQIALQTATFG